MWRSTRSIEKISNQWRIVFRCEGRDAHEVKITDLPLTFIPLNTTVEGVVRDGKIESLKVTPPERKADVILQDSQN